MLLAWKHAGVITYAGYILGFPNDTPESIRDDIEIIKRELPLDILEFFCLTPLPGSEDHQTLWHKGRLDGPRHEQVRPRARHHAPIRKMTREEWDTVYLDGLGALLHARAHEDDPAPRCGDRHGHVTAARGAVRVLGRVPGREAASAAVSASSG